jgi:hypothetical protein
LTNYEDFSFREDSGIVIITQYRGLSAQLAIPDRINGLPVTTIEDYALYGCSSLKSVSLSRRTKVEENTFPKETQISYSD